MVTDGSTYPVPVTVQPATHHPAPWLGWLGAFPVLGAALLAPLVLIYLDLGLLRQALGVLTVAALLVLVAVLTWLRAPAGRPTRPPRWVFHLILVAPAAGLLWAFNAPGIHTDDLASNLYSETLGGLSATALVAAAVVWVVWVLVTAISARRWSWWYTIAPLGGILVLTQLAP